MLPEFERTDRIGEFCGYPETRTLRELLIDCEEDRTLRAVLVGMLKEGLNRKTQFYRSRSLAGPYGSPGSHFSGSGSFRSPPAGHRAWS
jgi:hypothetical protein